MIRCRPNMSCSPLTGLPSLWSPSAPRRILTISLVALSILAGPVASQEAPEGFSASETASQEELEARFQRRAVHNPDSLYPVPSLAGVR